MSVPIDQDGQISCFGCSSSSPSRESSLGNLRQLGLTPFRGPSLDHFGVWGVREGVPEDPSAAAGHGPRTGTASPPGPQVGSVRGQNGVDPSPVEVATDAGGDGVRRVVGDGGDPGSMASGSLPGPRTALIRATVLRDTVSTAARRLPRLRGAPLTPPEALWNASIRPASSSRRDTRGPGGAAERRPGEVAGAGHAPQAGYPGHGDVGHLRVDHRERLLGTQVSCAKKAAASFRNSRSIRSCAFSCRGRSSSARTSASSTARESSIRARSAVTPAAQQSLPDADLEGHFGDGRTDLDHQQGHPRRYFGEYDSLLAPKTVILSRGPRPAIRMSTERVNSTTGISKRP